MKLKSVEPDHCSCWGLAGRAVNLGLGHRTPVDIVYLIYDQTRYLGMH